MRENIQEEGLFPNVKSDGLRLKLYMTKKLEEIIREKLGRGIEGRVVDINFAYHNSWLIDMLRTRGNFIKYQKWDKLNEMNRAITQRI